MTISFNMFLNYWSTDGTIKFIDISGKVYGSENEQIDTRFGTDL